MKNKFVNSWNLFKAAIAVTLRHRKLLWFPLLTGLATIVIALFFLSAMAIPLALHDTGYHLDQKQHWVALFHYYFPGPPPAVGVNAAPFAPFALSHYSKPPLGPFYHWGAIAFAILYFPSMFLAIFFNVAFYSEIMAALDGRGVSFRRGLRTARERWQAILTWSLFAGVVGWLIRTIEDRLPFAGKIFAGFIGLAWSVAAVFAVPVIIQEPATRNPVTVLRHSALTLKRSWGEGLIGYAGFSAGNLVIFACTLLPVALVVAVCVMRGHPWLTAIAFLVWLLFLFVAGYFTGVAKHIYRCTLFKYATEGVVPEPFTPELLDQAWKIKGR
ncbi:MAG TPA: DUF6159 family protein [Candidatus Sulfotelmatobacter sp.]|nr:DUF6159 family protein [Candidatus Sulfotelmatobacter sp.]